MQSLKSFVESQRFERAIIILIIINAITLGMETSPALMDAIGPVLLTIDRLILAVFVVELMIKFAVYRLDFFKSPWRIFDLIIVSIALIPAAGPFSVLRALRILRVLRLISAVPSMRRVVGGLLTALPGLGSIVLLLMLVFYVFSVMATKLFGGEFPQWFGSIAASAYSLFQIMTLESWSMGIVRPVMDAFPWAWAFFIPFIAATTFTVLNLFIGVVVSAMQAEHDAQAADERSSLHDEQTLILEEVRALRAEVRAMRAADATAPGNASKA
ncbi:MAG: ion transporter [Roseitalea sp.]|jgi:voltage-gated sodium channel|uniref:Ion transporter n=1 Tax=Oceaniradius stylonematis TaxID=2184161 RepID=A0A3A8AN62_9HYPH|nr:ion transporter [Oceaniradius stylonematis]MBO6553773.1 ion transporter [Roseitalea sp.]MBO6953103.1 ion transporter [Rhizobiaceae bacterium]MBO6593450.1 ion transporter [Roseitalea sp.]MBO6600560.1 ion transporter [Roseitalea sp.]MBO6612241.1 ion transporter [Roseitalea sp.]